MKFNYNYLVRNYNNILVHGHIDLIDKFIVLCNNSSACIEKNKINLVNMAYADYGNLISRIGLGCPANGDNHYTNDELKNMFSISIVRGKYGNIDYREIYDMDLNPGILPIIICIDESIEQNSYKQYEKLIIIKMSELDDSLIKLLDELVFRCYSNINVEWWGQPLWSIL